jgi:tetratricopeptide (TPR) repeat protein
MIAHGLRLASALLWFWHIRTRCEEGLLWLRRLLATELEVNIEQVFNSARTQRRAKALLVAGWMATELGEFDKAVEFYEEGRRLFQTLGTEGEWGIARIHYNLGAVAYYRGNLLLSENLLEESQAIFAKRGDRFWTSEIFQFLGAIAETKREYHRARMYFEHNLALKMKLGDQDGIADMLYHLGVVAYNEQFQVSDPDLDGQVSALFQESLEIFKKINSGAFFKPSDCLGYIKWRQGYYSKAAECFNLVLSYSRMIDSSGLIVSSLSNLGLLALSQEDYVRSTELFEESLDISLRRDHKDLIAWSLNNIGALACEKGDFDRAKRKYLEALSVSKEIGDRFLEADSYIGICKVLIAQDKFDPVRKFLADALEISQQSLDLQKIFCVLESFAFLAEYEMRTDADAGLERAAILLGATHAWHVKWQLTRTPRERAEREKAIASVREALGEAAFAAAWEEGQAMTLEQAIAYAKEDY